MRFVPGRAALSAALCVGFIFNSLVAQEAQVPKSPEPAPAPESFPKKQPGLWEYFQRNTPGDARDEIIVTASRIRAEGIKATRVPGAVTVIERADLDKSNAKTLAEFLENELGTVVYDETGNGMERTVELRGFNNGLNTVVMVDGVPVNESNSNLVYWATIPMESIERVEIQRGSNSIVAGRGAQAGIIHILTKKRADKGHENTFKTEAGEHGTFKFTDVVSGRSGKFFYQSHATRTEGATFRDNSDFRRTGAFTKLGWDLENMSFTMSLTHENSKFQEPASAEKRHLERDWSFSRKLRPDRRNYELNLFQFEWDWDITENFNASVIGFSRDNDTAALARFGTGAGGGGETVGKENEHGVAVQGSHHFVSDWLENRITLGGEARKTGFDTKSYTVDGAGNRVPGAFNPDPSSPLSDNRALDQLTHGFYLDDNVRLWEQLTLSLGWRADQSDIEFANRFNNVQDMERKFYKSSFKLGATQDVPFVEGLNAYAVYSDGYRLPTLNELFAFSVFPGGGENPFLAPEKSKNREAGLRYNFKNILLANATYFHVDTQDEIQVVTLDPIAFTVQNQNVGDTTRKGWELSVKARIFEPLTVWANYTRTDAQFRDGAFPRGNDVPLVPDSVLAIGASYDFCNYFSVSTDLRHTGKRVVGSDQNNLSPRLGDYTVWNAKLTAKWKWIEAHVGVNNIADKEYFGWGIRAFGGTDFFVPSPKREWTAGLSITYEF